MTQNDIIRRIIEQGGCQGISCDGSEGWNQGVRCPLQGEEGCTSLASVTLAAKGWADKHGLLPYSSTFTVEHRFKPGDRVQYKDATEPRVLTVEKVEFLSDCGAIYRLVNYRWGKVVSLVSHCDQHMRQADCEDEAGRTKEVEQ